MDVVSSNNQYDIIIELVKDHNVRLIKSNELKPSNNTTVSDSICAKATLFHKILDEKVGVIVKEFNYHKIDWIKLANELVLVSCLVHDHIPKFQGIIIDDDKHGKKKIALVTEHIEGKSLNDYKANNFEDLNEQDKLKIIKDLHIVFTYVHDMKFMHRDLNPNNLILDMKKNVYLTNFGFGKVLDEGDEKATRTAGTLNYSPPESVVNIDEDDQEIINLVTAKYDVWAFGCIVSLLYTNEEPWNTKSNSLISKKLKDKAKFIFKEANITNEAIKPHIIKIIRMCTEVDSTKRCSMKDLKPILDEMK